MSPLSTTQQGLIGQQEFAKLLMLGTDGELEVTWSLTDDERRDLETHVHGEFGRSLAIQVKSTTYLEHRWKARHLAIHFPVREDRLTDHPLFWYFFAYLDRETMAFADPAFLVPSGEVHAHASPKLRGDTWSFLFAASLEPTSRDRWRDFRVAPRAVGPRVLDILKKSRRVRVPAAAATRRVLLPPETVWVRKR